MRINKTKTLSIFLFLSLLSMINSFRLRHSLSLVRRTSIRRMSDLHKESPSPSPPVSLLAGFLGAGKTSTLTHILQNREGLKVGVIVNDVASVNVDANVVKRLLSSDQDHAVTDMIELENGCVCCGPEAGQLAPAVKSLIKTGIDRGDAFDQIVIELSGVADPSMVTHNLEEGGVSVDRVVTLIDSDSFPLLYHSADPMDKRSDLGGGKEISEIDPCVAMKKVVELLIAQIEEADLIIANKLDIASESSMLTTLALCKALNENATVHQAKLGQISLSKILPSLPNTQTHHTHHHHHHTHDHDHSHSHAHDEACSVHDCDDPTHDHSHSHSHAASGDSLAAENLGISNFVYRATRPFSEKKLMSRVIDVWPIPQKDLLSLTDYSKAPIEDEEDGRSQPTNSSFASVLRSKGWVTLDQYPNQGIYWTHAGRHLGLELVPSMNNSDDEMASIGQEVVFIGMKMNESKITQELDNCLLNDEELIRYHERVKARTDPRLQEVERPRFGVGTMVQALTGPDTWEVGRVVAVHYREPTWPDGKYAPYQIELNGGDLIYAPADIDSIIRAV